MKKTPFSNVQRTSRGFNSYAQVEALYGYRKEDQKLWKRNGCPAFRNGLIYVDELEEWLKGEGIETTDGGGDGGDDSPKEPRGTPEEVNRERIKKMQKEQRALDREHDIKMGKLVLMDEVKANIAIVMDQLTGILKKTCDRQQYNAISKQFQSVDFKGLHAIE